MRTQYINFTKLFDKKMYPLINNRSYGSCNTNNIYTKYMDIHRIDNHTKKISGINCDTLRDVLKTTNFVSCIYLFKIGTVNELRAKYNISDFINDDDCVAKYGKTIELSRRLSEHKKKYGPNIELLLFEYIKNNSLMLAESCVRKYLYMMGMNLITTGERELVILTKNTFENIRQEFEMIGSKYR